MYDLTTIGDIKLDVFINLGKRAKVACGINKEACLMQLKYGEKIPVESAVVMPAGSAPNISIGVRRLGKTTSIESVVGDDTTAVLATDILTKERVATQHIHIHKGTKSSFSAVLNLEGESTILAVHQPHVYTLPDNMHTKWLFVTEMGPRYKELFTELTERTNKARFKLAINPGALQLEDSSKELFDLLAVSDLLIVNKFEAQLLAKTDTPNIKTLLRKLQSLGPKTIVITQGNRGAYATENSEIYHAPAFPGKKIETTGAGDAFAAGFIAALLYKKNLETALAWGSIDSASVIGFTGPQKGLLTKKELEKRLSENKRYKVTIR